MTVQAMYLELLRHTRFNCLDGAKVAQELADHPQLWLGAMICRRDSLITLRDLRYDRNNADTLYILVAPGKEAELEKLAQRWDTDSIYFLEEEECHTLLGTSEDFKVLECWWD